MTAAELRIEIEAMVERMRPLEDELVALRSQLRDAVSREWIAANGVTLEDVQLPWGDDIPVFLTVYKFGDWMRSTGCKKRWAEWNGALYSSAELMAGRMARDAPGLLEHVPK